MIGHLKGVVLQQDLKSIILDVAGVGYKIYTNTAILDGKKEKILEFWTYLAVRENSLDLYGFAGCSSFGAWLATRVFWKPRGCKKVS